MSNDYDIMKGKIIDNLDRHQHIHANIGYALGIIHEGTVDLIRCGGVTDKKTKEKVTQETIFELGSISKSFTSWTIMRLVEDGMVSLDVPISTYIDVKKLGIEESKSHEITISKIMSHTAGFSVPGYLGSMKREKASAILDSLNGNDHHCKKIDIIEHKKEKFSYSGGGYSVLQYLIEQVTGQSFQKYVQENLLEPLNLKASFKNNTFEESHFAKPHNALGIELPSTYFSEIAAAGICMDLNNLLRFVCYHFERNNSILSENSLKKIFHRVSPTILYGMGYYAGYSASKYYVISRGRNIGYYSRFDVFQHNGEAMVLLTNSSVGSNLSFNLLQPWYQYQLLCETVNQKRLYLENVNRLYAFLYENKFILQHLF